MLGYFIGFSISSREELFAKPYIQWWMQCELYFRRINLEVPDEQCLLKCGSQTTNSISIICQHV